MRGGEEFYSSRIRSQSFSEPVSLDCERHKSVSGFFLLLRGDRMAIVSRS